MAIEDRGRFGREDLAVDYVTRDDVRAALRGVRDEVRSLLAGASAGPPAELAALVRGLSARVDALEERVGQLLRGGEPSWTAVDEGAGEGRG